MAQQMHVVLVDDVDGGHADETVKFALDGAQYEIDLSSANAVALRQALAPWVKAGRKTSSRAGATRGRGASPDTGKIRAWAKANGHDVSERGRISAQVRAAYEASR